MKVIGKILKILGILLLSLVLLLAAADAAWIYVPQIKAAKRIDDVDAYAAPVEALTVREGAGIIALGEATYGNAEFQRLRRDVLERLTEEYGVRSFALEADFGEAAGVDEYIKGGAGTAAQHAEGVPVVRAEHLAEFRIAVLLAGVKVQAPADLIGEALIVVLEDADIPADLLLALKVVQQRPAHYFIAVGQKVRALVQHG